jgi:hypothetical protein
VGSISGFKHIHRPILTRHCQRCLAIRTGRGFVSEEQQTTPCEEKEEDVQKATQAIDDFGGERPSRRDVVRSPLALLNKLDPTYHTERYDDDAVYDGVADADAQ